VEREGHINLGFCQAESHCPPSPSPISPILPIYRHVGSATLLPLLPLLDSISRLIKDRWPERTPSRSFQPGRVSASVREARGREGEGGGGVTSTDSNRFHETPSPIMTFSVGSGKSILRFRACLLIARGLATKSSIQPRHTHSFHDDPELFRPLSLSLSLSLRSPGIALRRVSSSSWSEIGDLSGGFISGDCCCSSRLSSLSSAFA